MGTVVKLRPAQPELFEEPQTTHLPGAPAQSAPIDVSRETLRRPTDTDAVFEFWRNVLSNPRSRLDDRRRKAITARLRDGYTVEDLQLAVIGCGFSPHHQGHNDRHRPYQDIELICRDAQHVDDFVRIAEEEGARLMRAREAEAARAKALEERQADPRIADTLPGRSPQTETMIQALMEKLGIRKAGRK